MHPARRPGEPHPTGVTHTTDDGRPTDVPTPVAYRDLAFTFVFVFAFPFCCVGAGGSSPGPVLQRHLRRTRQHQRPHVQQRHQDGPQHNGPQHGPREPSACCGLWSRSVSSTALYLAGEWEVHEVFDVGFPGEQAPHQGFELVAVERGEAQIEAVRGVEHEGQVSPRVDFHAAPAVVSR